MTQGILVITDGTTRIDLLSLFVLGEWTPQTAQAKGGGVWRDSPFLQGRQLVLHEYENIIDTFELKAKGDGDVNLLICNTQDLRRLLEKAIAYWVTDWQNDPVWIETRGICETNTRYAIIHDYRTPNDDNPFFDPVSSHAVFDDWTLILEHGLWLDNEPGSATALEIGATETYDGRNLGNVNSSGTFTPTTADEVYVANKRNIANLTDVYYYDASGPAWSANLMDAALPFAFLPAVPAVGDIVYYGIDTSIADSGPFCSIVHDIGTAQNDLTIIWEYWNGAWVALTEQDGTAKSGDAFDTTGVNSVHWRVPSDWATTAVNGITGYWVRARVTAIGAGPSAPAQQNRDIYSAIWPYIEIGSDQVSGDVPSIAKIQFKNQSDGNISPGNAPDIYDNRIIMGMRSTSRGDNFTAYMNCSQEQNPTNIAIAVADTPAVEKSPTGEPVLYNPAGAIDPISLRLRFFVNDPLANEYVGTYRAFIRVWNDISAGGNIDDFSVRLYVTYKTYGAIYESETQITQTSGNPELIDCGVFTITNFDNETIETLYFDIEAGHLVATNSVLYLVDLILIPVDEWAADISDFSEDLLSGGTWIGSYNGAGSDRSKITIDSVGQPKIKTYSILKKDVTEYLMGKYKTVTNNSVQIVANQEARLWMVSERYDTTASPIQKISNFESSSRIIVESANQYIGMRGDR